ncbi:hypothetical protein NECAME_18618 [Necator americanus]|uniref:Uncharacterized protein n=1 Tax=Necator americanus TaxID=51031 RepID=W2STG2_NECAM|nr:hypothetical protein NECAME_18618 [Necator americanus]ETN72915.1 hypothetical protein NECAME_18618 [Necator americanus]
MTGHMESNSTWPVNQIRSKTYCLKGNNLAVHPVKPVGFSGYLRGREKFNLDGMDIDIIGEICVKRPCSSRAATSEAVH